MLQLRSTREICQCHRFSNQKILNITLATIEGIMLPIDVDTFPFDGGLLNHESHYYCIKKYYRDRHHGEHSFLAMGRRTAVEINWLSVIDNQINW